MVRSSTRLPFVLGFLGEVDQLKFSWIVGSLPLQVEVVVYTYLCVYEVMNLIR
jgi:hypothetical protein